MNRSRITPLLLILGATLFAAPLPAQTVYPTGTTIWQHGTDDGYTLFIGGDGIVYLIDMNGMVVNSWKSPYANEVLNSVEPLASGNILVFSGAPFPGSIDKIRELD